MRRIIQALYAFSQALGYDPKQTIKALRALPSFFKDYRIFLKQHSDDGVFKAIKLSPILRDKYAQAGSLKGHYFHQDYWVARKIFKENPVTHVDIGSRLDGLVAHVAVFRKIEVLDIRELDSKIDNISFRQANLMNLPAGMENYCDSISSLHALEHFGLGRYGDPIDSSGYIKGIENIHKILTPKGKFYFSTPIGDPRIEFNAQRVFSINHLIEVLSPYFSIKCFSYVDDNGDLHEDVDLANPLLGRNMGCHYGCGIFELEKK